MSVFTRTTTVVAATAAALILGSGVALAHVSVNPSTVAAGGYTVLTFRVPNESPTASTVSVEIDLPADTPFASVRAKQTPGWSVELMKEKLPAVVSQGTTNIDEAILKVVFTADKGASISPNQFADFDLSVGPVPTVPTITFAAVQTYSDGKVVTWNEATPASGDEPDHPAPVLTISGEETGDHHGAAAPGSVSVTAADTPPMMAAGENDSTARTLGIVGVILGALGLGGAVLALRGRKPAGRVDRGPQRDKIGGCSESSRRGSGGDCQRPRATRRWHCPRPQRFDRH
ncbi:DUF1775 domain-containing protein [Nakamurella antarctica]|uniref:DUF1775 domain-containing protein n=1 Tax=Nakamurella antarctica TaxID=1902245 RepID=A0A3G8ZJK6_9ACTN|nr:YcnI family protein [Nakamurella antarctica]AZI57025.1 DUF1775 domain-containing protein [Nakamurella antarctica]